MSTKIILQCDVGDISHIRITRQIEGIKVEYGLLHRVIQWKIPVPEFDVKHTEFFPFKEKPELTFLHDGFGWNIADVMAFCGTLKVQA